MSEQKPLRIQWCIPVSKTLDNALEEAVSAGTHSSKAEFVRDAVRLRLEDMGLQIKISGIKFEVKKG